jgi:hypothetical protein
MTCILLQHETELSNGCRGDVGLKSNIKTGVRR